MLTMKRPKKMLRAIWIVLIVFLILNEVATEVETCPEKCVCKRINETLPGLRVKCGGVVNNKITSMKEIDFSTIQDDTVFLDLSKNQIGKLNKSDFTNFTNLKRLDLTQNSLKSIELDMFGEIKTLERLKLSTNLIAHIYQGSLDGLVGLKQLDITNNPLACDCDLLWLIPWSQNLSIKLQAVPKCETPAEFKDQPVKKLKIGTDFHCESPLQPLLELKPDTDQLVYEGDSLTLRCRAPRVAVGAPRDSEDLPVRAHVLWGWSNTIVDPTVWQNITYLEPSIHFPTIRIDDKHLSDSGFLDSILFIPKLTSNHTGTWDCRLRPLLANLSRSISVYVISNSTKYCKSTETRNNKGRYSWPITVRGQTVTLPCSGDILTNIYATYKCDLNGEWINLDTSACPYISDVTRVLEQFSKLPTHIDPSSVLARLKNYTIHELDKEKYLDPMDVVFIARTIENYLSFITNEKDMGITVFDIVSHILTLSGDLLTSAESIDHSCQKLIYATEYSVDYVNPSEIQKNNMAMEVMKTSSDNFLGISCTWYKTDFGNEKVQKMLQCNTMNTIHGVGINDRQIISSVQIPESLLSDENSDNKGTDKLVVTVFENSNLFPFNATEEKYRDYKLTSSVIGVNVTLSVDTNLTEPIMVFLRASPFHHQDSYPVPVWWDVHAKQWSFDGCESIQYYHGMLLFSCNQLGYYGLVQHKKHLNDFEDENAGARFRISPVGLYIGSFILFFCTWVNIITYLIYSNHILMARRTKHTVMNIWLAISLLVLLFSVGIYQTEDCRLCQVIGISIHYLSLAVILWICVAVSNMYKRIAKTDKNISLPNEEMPKEISIHQKPILGMYLVGWGIPFIICGISVAVNMRDYASYSFCFLSSSATLSALFVPTTILLLFLLVMFSCVRCHIRCQDDIGHMSEGTQATENVDLDLLEPIAGSHNNHHNNGENVRSYSISTPTTSTQDDLEYSYGSQLKAYIFVVFMYVVTWTMGAVCVVSPLKEFVSYGEDLLAGLYAACAITLAIFLLFYYTLARSDVRYQYSLINCKNFGHRKCCRSRSVSDTQDLTNTPYVSYQIQPIVTMNTISRSNSQSSKNRPHTSSALVRGAVGLNSHTLNRSDSPGSHKLNGNMNLVLMHRQQYVHNQVIGSGEEMDPDVFYNANQINVARKFFRKQKRLAKRNNFDIQRKRVFDQSENSDCASSIVPYGRVEHTPEQHFSLLSSGSKVNNTNIHIDARNVMDNVFTKDTRQNSMNPNILSDDSNDNDLMGAERFVLGADGLRILSVQRGKVNNSDIQQYSMPMVANIYTNVPETQQPQHEIVTMRADDKFKKQSNLDASHQQCEDGEDLDTTQETINLNSSSDRTCTPIYANDDVHRLRSTDQTPDSPRLELHTNCDLSNGLMFSLNSSLLAMNTVGLPTVGIDTMGKSEDVVIDVIDKDLPSDEEGGGRNCLYLRRDDAYVSAPLVISNETYQQKVPENGLVPKPKSKSLDELKGSNESFGNILETQPRSISFNNIISLENIPEAACVEENSQQESRSSNSPILFSPSLCDLDELQSPAPVTNFNFKGRSFISTPVGSDPNIYYNESNSDNLNVFNRMQQRNYTSSPTSESDLNYQHSEISIRSHYIMGGEERNPYRSAEASDIEEDDDGGGGGDRFRNQSRVHLLASNHEEKEDDEMHDSDTSIDELYERITRGSGAKLHSIGSNKELCMENESELIEEIKEQEDDSSQCSIISFVESSGMIAPQN